MRKLAFNILALLCAGIIHNSVSGSSIYAKDFEKVIKEEFTISESGKVDISNRYGTVKINTTGGNEVVIEVTIKVDTRNEDKAEEFFDKVDIDFSSSSSEVSATTEIGNQKSSSWTSWLNPKNWNNNNEYSINYEVWMPASCSLDLANRYGDVAVGDLDGDVRLQLKYGDGILEDVGGDFELDLGYGDVKMGNTNDMELDIKYGEFKCGTSRDINCDTKYSEIHIDKARRMNTETGYDDYFLGEVEILENDGHYDDFDIEYVGQIDFDSRYTDYVIQELGAGGIFDSGYGELKVRQVTGLSKGLEVEGSYSDVSLGINVPFNIDLESKYTDVSLPSSMDYSKRIQDGNEEDVVAKSGNSSSNNITAEMRYGSFKIRAR